MSAKLARTPVDRDVSLRVHHVRPVGPRCATPARPYVHHLGSDDHKSVKSASLHFISLIGKRLARCFPVLAYILAPTGVPKHVSAGPETDHEPPLPPLDSSMAVRSWPQLAQGTGVGPGSITLGLYI